MIDFDEEYWIDNEFELYQESEFDLINTSCPECGCYGLYRNQKGQEFCSSPDCSYEKFF